MMMVGVVVVVESRNGHHQRALGTARVSSFSLVTVHFQTFFRITWPRAMSSPIGRLVSDAVESGRMGAVLNVEIVCWHALLIASTPKGLIHCPGLCRAFWPLYSSIELGPVCRAIFIIMYICG